MSTPKVSVIIPTHNRADLVAESVQSVLDQTFQDYELVVVDDGSTDDTARLLESFLDNPKVRYLHQPHLGPGAARNTGIRSTDGELVAFLDSDDAWLEQKLEKQVGTMDSQPEAGLVYTDVYFIDSQGRILTDRQWAQRKRMTIFEDLLFQNVITGSASSSMLRRECLGRVGLFDESLRSVEDLDLWLRVARHYHVVRLGERLTKIRHHQSNIQLDVDRMAEGWTAHLGKREVPAQYVRAERLARYEILCRIARQYYELDRMKQYRQYALKAVGGRRRHIVNPRFWKRFVRSYLGLRPGRKQSWVTRTLKN